MTLSEANHTTDQPHIVVIDAHGRRHLLAAQTGLSIMAIVRAAKFDLEGECEGSLACASCHLWIGEDWVDQLDPATDDEEDMLDVAFNLQPTSRLSCQIRFTPELSGLEVQLPG